MAPNEQMEVLVSEARQFGYKFPDPPLKRRGIAVYVSASFENKDVGNLTCDVSERLRVLTLTLVRVSEEHRRRGLATAMAAYAKLQHPSYKMNAVKNFEDDVGRLFFEKLRQLGIIDE
jgi:hypothetical protein